MANHQSSLIRDEIEKLLTPLKRAASEANGLSMLIQVVGHVGALGQNPELQAELKRLAQLADDIAALDVDELGSFKGLSRLLDLAGDLMAALQTVELVLSDPALALRAQNLGKELAASLFALYLRAYHSRLFRTGVVLALITPAEETDPEQMIVENGTVNRLPWAPDRFHFDRIPTLIEDPFGLLKAQYLPDGMVHAQDAYLAAARLFPSLRELAKSLDLGWVYDLVRVAPEIVIPGPDPDEGGGGGLWPPEDDMVEVPELDPFDLSQFQRDYRPRLTVYLPGDNGGVSATSRLGLIVIASSAEHPDEVRGYIIALVGDANWSEVRGDWRLELLVDGSIPAFVIGPEGVEFAPLGTPVTAATAKFVVERIAEPGAPAFLLGSPNGTHIEIGAFRFRADLALSPGRQIISLSTEANSGALVLAAGEADSFLNAVLSDQGVRVEFDFGLILSSDRGLELKGGAGLDLLLSPNVTLGPVVVRTIRLNLGTLNGDIQFRVTGTIGVRLGPIRLTVEEFGVQVTASFPSTGGSFGPVDINEGLYGPSGAGITIDGQGFSGGGFLRYVEADQRYEGVLELEYLKKITLKAIGLLTTRLPDGSEGFSLLIVITAEFNPPFELGLGFKLRAVGGLLGLNRTADVERLRTGLKDNTLRSILFPQKVIENASRIISDLGQVFPPRTDRFIFGPMARIEWGTPALLTIDLGLLIEVPAPVRLFILGVLRALLPDEDKRLLQLQVNFLGVIDFEARRFSFDASLFDSKLLSYTLSGDMAVRLTWGGDPSFLLTVGGFHPNYQPPPLNLPPLRRLSLQLLGDNPRLTLETYFAVTSNTVQFGAKLELYAGAGKFNLYGFLSFDVLFQFNPFYFIASISAKLALRVGSSSIASISLAFTLEGPTPWHAKGTAKLKLCWFITIKVRFDKTFGERRTTTLPDVAVFPLLKEALSQPGNWQAQPPGQRQLLVSLVDLEAGEKIVAHPFGVLLISQKVVPLNTEIQKFGSQRPSDAKRFSIKRVWVGETAPPPSDALGITPVKEQFAPAQFFEIPDGQKLTRKSFEQHDGGIKISDAEKMEAVYGLKREIRYELSYIDAQRETPPPPVDLSPDALAFETWATQGAIADSPLSFARRAKSALAPAAVGFRQEPFAVVTRADMRPVNGLFTSEAEAYSSLTEMIRVNPALEGEIQVVPGFEVNGS